MSGPLTFRQYINRFQKVSQLMGPAITKALNDAAPIMKSAVRASTSVAPPASARGGYGAVATGQLLNSWEAKVVSGNKGILISNSQVQAVIADYGRARGARMPPLDAIQSWAQTRLGLSYEQAKKSAWPIARAIAQRGLKKRGILHSDQMNRQLMRIMEMRMSKAIATTFRKAFGV